MRAVLFNGFDLQAAPFKVDSTDAFSAPVREIITHELERSDNAVDVFRRYSSRDITISGTIHAETEADCDVAIDTLKLALLQSGVGQLQLEYAGGYRYWNAEARNLNIARAATDVTRAAWSCELHVPRFYATDGNTDILLNTTTTLGSFSTTLSPLGTYLSKPLISLTYGAVSPSTSDIDITIGNPNSNDTLTVTETVQAGDVLTLDTLNELVFLNSQLLAPVGSFPSWQPGQASGFDYTDSATSRSVTIYAEAVRTFI